MFWTKKLYLPATITNGKASFRLREDRTSLGVEFAHQAWRYGVESPPMKQRLRLGSTKFGSGQRGSCACDLS
jgi:hypothetical protein